jgi:hypothetical protein
MGDDEEAVHCLRKLLAVQTGNEASRIKEVNSSAQARPFVDI